MKKLAITFVFASFLFSCAMDEHEGTISLNINSQIMLLKSSDIKPPKGVYVTDFKLCFGDLDFNQDQNNLDWNDLEFKGPFKFDLLDYKNSLTHNVGFKNLKEGVYKTLGLYLYASSPSSPLKNRALFLRGYVDGVPFEFWHNTNENFKIFNPNGIIVDCNDAEILINFDIYQFFSAVNTVNLSIALDQNNDGIIQINPKNDDGNAELARMIKENIFASATIIKK